jgi:hypothetical protein
MTTLSLDQAARLADCGVEDWPRYVQTTALVEVRLVSGRPDANAQHVRWLLGQAYLASCRRDGALAAACLRLAGRVAADPEIEDVLPLVA